MGKIWKIQHREKNNIETQLKEDELMQLTRRSETEGRTWRISIDEGDN